jgi:hypothetical protein
VQRQSNVLRQGPLTLTVDLGGKVRGVADLVCYRRNVWSRSRTWPRCRQADVAGGKGRNGCLGAIEAHGTRQEPGTLRPS